MEHAIKYKKFIKSALLGFIALIAISADASALDNPDAPDLINPFKVKAARFEADISRDSGGGPGLSLDINKYDVFLDQQLNAAYRLLMGKLDSANRLDLIKSQKSWLAYRDNEIKFIENNWNADKFGSSATLSIGQYREEIIKERILTLLQYLRNYS